MRNIKDFLIIMLFIFGIAGSLGACEIGRISIPQMFSQVAQCGALMALVARVEVVIKLAYQMLQRLRKAAQSVPRNVRRLHSRGRGLKVH